jgi:exonuclease VII large subunit
MAETPSTPLNAPEPHWSIIYLREDLQDLRQDTRQQFDKVHPEMQQQRQENQQQFQDMRQENQQQFQELYRRTDANNDRIAQVETSLTKRMDEKFEHYSKRHDTQFTWLIATMVSLTGMLAGLIKF